MANLESFIRDVPDFPKPGILFKDITPLLASPAAFAEANDTMLAPFANEQIDVVVGIESRGFLFGTHIAEVLKVPFVPIRKAGKLPYETISETYDLEYGTATIEVHIDAVSKGQRVLIVDDLLATGGTTKAACSLIQRLGGELVGATFLIDLAFLPGRSVLEETGLRVEAAIDVN
ncbi:MAG: adenine phosphoribosyltransferase [Phycisphaerales bacterium]|jgi:adenine phosphoribosyltransferase|nr:adenine phosphoribosyltransferase [Phycisphaerales bacterium]MBT7170235.1 adenine phosphoribosyltransferase [Phycisphaerales bacterium]